MVCFYIHVLFLYWFMVFTATVSDHFTDDWFSNIYLSIHITGKYCSNKFCIMFVNVIICFDF